MTLDVRELVRRLRAGETCRAVARDLGVARKTVARYQRIAREQGWLEGPLLSTLELERCLAGREAETPLPPPVYKAEPHRERIKELRDKGVEVQAIFERLQERGYTGSYSSLYRFVRHLEPALPPEGFCRIETDPGEEAQVDFGYAGVMTDRATGEPRRAWFFVMTLSYSRHQYVRFVFDQTIETWLRCHRLAFEWFGGVPGRVKVDNLKAAIVTATFHDPVVQRSYREFAEHYGFLVSPCRPRTPEHKGKVESGVRYVKRNFLAGRTFQDLQQANEEVEVWIVKTAGLRIHGTIQERPLARFYETEKAALPPLPAAPYDMGIWSNPKLHPDCHLQVNGAFYSAPHRFIGERLWVRSNSHDVVIYHEHERIATHAWTRAGTRRTDRSHYPPDKVASLMATPQWCRERAEQIGPATRDLVHRLLDERPLDRLRGVQAILRLEGKHGADRLEAACRRALLFGDLRSGTVQRILDRSLENAPIEWAGSHDSTDPRSPKPAAKPPVQYAFARPGSEIFGLRETGGMDHGRQTPVDPQAQGAAALRHLGDVGRA